MTKEYYLIEDLQVKLNKTRTRALRFAQEQGWKITKKKIGKVYKNVYEIEEVDAYFNSLVKKEEEKRPITRTVAKREATQVDELPSWNQRVANSRFILCKKLEEDYETLFESKAEIIEKFVKEANTRFPQQMKVLKNLTVPTLRRWWGVYIKNRNNPLALASKHGSNKGLRRVQEDVITTAKALYFNKNKPKISVVFIKLIEIFGHDAISYSTLRNIINNDINIIEKNKARMGAKEFKDTHIPYIERSYEDIKAGEIWMSDGHDLELMCYQGDRKKSNGERYFGSPKIVVWIDVKSRLITGWTLTWTETTESIAIALKRGIEKYGIPKKVYTDNGKAYKSKVLKGTEEIEGIYANLGLETSNALPYNAQAKHIERWFVDFKESFAKEFYTYKGGNILERKEEMKSFALKKIDTSRILEQEELEVMIENFIEYKNHRFYEQRRAAGLKAHRGRGMKNRTPLEVFNEENPINKRKMLDDEKLRLLFLYEEIRTVQQNGIEHLGNRYANEHLYFHLAEKVKIKYDPKDLSFIYVYLETGEFLCKADKLNLAGWNDVESIKAHQNRVKAVSKLNKKVVGIMEEIRETNNIIEYNYKEKIKTIEEKTTKNSIKIADGIYVEI